MCASPCNSSHLHKLLLHCPRNLNLPSKPQHSYHTQAELTYQLNSDLLIGLNIGPCSKDKGTASQLVWCTKSCRITQQIHNHNQIANSKKHGGTQIWENVMSLTTVINSKAPLSALPSALSDAKHVNVRHKHLQYLGEMQEPLPHPSQDPPTFTTPSSNPKHLPCRLTEVDLPEGTAPNFPTKPVLVAYTRFHRRRRRHSSLIMYKSRSNSLPGTLSLACSTPMPYPKSSSSSSSSTGPLLRNLRSSSSATSAPPPPPPQIHTRPPQSNLTNKPTRGETETETETSSPKNHNHNPRYPTLSIPHASTTSAPPLRSSPYAAARRSTSHHRNRARALKP